MSFLHKHCPHCLKLIPFKKRLSSKCPHCFRQVRRRSQDKQRGPVGSYLEERGPVFWFFMLITIITIGAMIGQLGGHSELLNNMDHHTFWFLLTVYYLAIWASVIGRIYLPLMLDAPKILRRERNTIRWFKMLTTTGMIVGIPFSFYLVGTNNIFYMFEATAFLFTVPIALMWAFQGLVVSDADYEDPRTWSYLAEIGCDDRMEYRRRSFSVLVMLPLAAFLFYFFCRHKGYGWAFLDNLLVDMFKDLYHRATSK